MKKYGSIVLFASLLFWVCAFQPQSNVSASPASKPATQPMIADRADDVHPLKEGERAPTAILHRPDGEAVDLSKSYPTKPTVLIFYRGGWCPYCNAHLGQIAKAEPELVKLGYQVVAISPDSPESLRSTEDKNGYTYQLLSDSEMELAKAFGLAFRVDAATIEKYHGFGIDLEKASGQKHHLLPVPAVYILDTKGVIRFAHWNPDYKKRISSEDLLAAARKAIGP